MRRLLYGAMLGSLICVLLGGTAQADKPTSYYLTVNKNTDTTDAVTDATLWDPDAGYRFILQGCAVSADAAQTVQFEVSDVDVIPPLYLAANGNAQVGIGDAPIYVSAVDAILTYTTTTSANTTVVCWGWQDII